MGKNPGKYAESRQAHSVTHARDLEFHVTENTVWMDDPQIGTQSQAETFRVGRNLRAQ